MLERRQENKLPALRDIPKKRLEETALQKLMSYFMKELLLVQMSKD